MKKKVRIYKAPDGQGAFLNKTAKFLKKAQEGGMPDPSMMGYPGAQQDQGQTSEDQIAQSIVVDISNGRPKEETVVKLVQFMGQDPMQASQYYDQIYAALESQKEQDEEEADEDSESEPVKEEIEQNQTEEIEEDFYGDDSNTDIANDIAAEDDEDYADDDQVASDIVMQFGGVSPVIVPIRQEGGESYPIQFPGIEAYLPFNMSEMLSGDVDPLTGQAWSPQAEEETAVASDDEVQTDFRNGGQYKKNKRSYVNSVMKLVKKQMGGEDMSKKGDTDPRGEDVRKQRLDSFLGTVKNQAQMAKAKEQAEQEYDQMMQQQQMMQQPMEQPMAQYGMQTPMRRGLFGRPRMPRGVGFGYGMPISKMDVRRTGIFGRPKEYTMEFGMPGAMPGVALPGYGAGFYGYGQTSTIKKGKSPGRIITETVAETVNKASNTEVASNTPDNTATNKSDDKNSSATTPNSTANNVQVNTATSNKRKGVQVTDEVTDTVVNNSNAKRKETEVVETIQNTSSKKQGDGLYSYPGNNAIYKKKDGVWYIDPSGTGANFKKITTDKDSRVKRLEAQATPYSSRPKAQSYVNINDAPASFGTEGNKYLDISTVKAPTNYKAPIQIGSEQWFKLTPAQQRRVYEEQLRRNPSEARKAWNNLKSLPKSIFYNAPKNVYNQSMRQVGGQAYYNPFGGFVDSENPDLYKFVYGGNDPYFTQGDLDDVYSKDTSDPYFKYGGLKRYDDGDEVKSDPYEDYRKKVGDKLGMSLRDDLSAKELFEMGNKAGIGFGNDNTTTTKKKTTTTQNQQYNPYANIGYNGFNAFGNLFPANIASYQGSWGKVKRGPYNKTTGMMMPGYGFGPNTQLSSIDVTKSGMFGRPKKYTMNFSNQEMDPRKQNLITLPGQGTPGTAGYAGQEQGTGASNIYSNTEGLKGSSRRAIRKGERRTAREVARGEEEFPETTTPTGDVASTSNQPSPTQTSLSDQDEIAKFQHQQRQRGKRWDEEKQAWVDQEQIKMELNKPGKIAATKDIQGRMDQEALSKEAKESFADYGDITPELDNKNVQSEYQKIYETRGKEAAENFMDDQFRKRNAKIKENEPATPEEQAESERQDIINKENMTTNPMFMGRRSDADEVSEQTSIDQKVTNPDAEVKQTPSFEEYTGMQRFNPETGQEEVVEDEESFGPVRENLFPPTSIDDEYAGYGYDIEMPSEKSNRNRSRFNKRQNSSQTKTVTITENGRKVQKEVPLTREERKVQNQLDSSARRLDKDNRTPDQKAADDAAYKKARIAESERMRRESEGQYDNPKEQKRVEEGKKRSKTMTAAYNELYEKPLQEVTTRRDRIINDLKNNPRLSKEERDRKITETEQWYQKKERQLKNKADEQSDWYQEEMNKSGRRRQFGGDLSRFIPKAPGGAETPVTYTNNPALVGMSNVDMISLNEGIPGLGQSSLTSFMNTNAPVRDQSQDPKEIKTDPTQISSDQAKKEYQGTPGDYSMDFKVKNMYEIDPEAAINVANAGVRGVTGMIERMRNKKREAKMYDNLTADNLYASDPSRDRGDYDVNTGLYRPDEQGATHTSRSAQYGGMMYQDGGYYDEEDDDVAYMTEDQIRQFLANGGEIEYL